MGKERRSWAKVRRAKERLVENQLKYGGKKPNVKETKVLTKKSKWRKQVDSLQNSLRLHIEEEDQKEEEGLRGRGRGGGKEKEW